MDDFYKTCRWCRWNKNGECQHSGTFAVDSLKADQMMGSSMERWETRLESAKMRLYAVAVGTKDTIKDIITVSAINPAPAKKLAKELYHKIHPTTPIEQIEADIVERGRNW